jgi:hypothetical protein
MQSVSRKSFGQNRHPNKRHVLPNPTAPHVKMEKIEDVTQPQPFWKFRIAAVNLCEKRPVIGSICRPGLIFFLYANPG